MSKAVIIVALFAVAVLCLPVLAVFNFVDPMTYVILSFAVTMLLMLTMVMAYMFTRGVIEPALMARFRGQALWLIVSSTRRFRLAAGTMTGKIFNCEYGSYMSDPEASFMWPHGVSGSIAVDSRAVGLRPDIVNAVTEAKKLGAKTFADVERMEKDAV